MSRRTFQLIVPALCVLLLSGAPASAEVVRFEVAVSGANQVPPADTSGTGVLVAEFDTETHRLTWTITYDGLTGPPTAAHFHGPGEIGVNAPVLVPLESTLDSPITGEAVLTEEEAGYLMDGLLYLNIHTGRYPGGEIRGQLIPLTE
jgi:hypothetical protein